MTSYKIVETDIQCRFKDLGIDALAHVDLQNHRHYVEAMLVLGFNSKEDMNLYNLSYDKKDHYEFEVRYHLIKQFKASL